MKSMFWKMFLSFWFAMILIGIAFATVYVSNVPEVKRARRSYMLQHAFQLHGMRMRRLIHNGDMKAALAINVSLRKRFKAHAYFFRDGKLLASPLKPSPLILRLAAKARRENRAVNEVATPLDAFATLLPCGKKYTHKDVIVGTIPHLSRLTRYLQPKTLLLRLAILFVVAGLLCYFLASLLTSPIMRLRETAQRLAEGDLTARVDPKVREMRDEIGELGRDFDQMAAEIQGLLGAQTRLLRDISHELRSPLARLSVALGITRQKADNGASSALDRIEREADRLNELIGQLLTLTALESEHNKITPQPFSLSELLEHIVHDADFEARDLDCEVALTRVEDIECTGSPELLHQALENVVRNAIRFTAANTIVEVSLAMDKSGPTPTAVITVQDHGPGVPEDMLEKLFQPFFQVEDARIPQSGGTGLGLAITQRAIRRHQGDVVATNGSDGGLCVTIRLPVNRL